MLLLSVCVCVSVIKGASFCVFVAFAIVLLLQCFFFNCTLISHSVASGNTHACSNFIILFLSLVLNLICLFGLFGKLSLFAKNREAPTTTTSLRVGEENKTTKCNRRVHG